MARAGVTLNASGKSKDSTTPVVVLLAGADAGIVLALRDSEGDTRQGLDILMSKLKNVEDVESEFNPTAERIALGDLRPQLASLAISREKANRHVEGIKRFERK